MKFGGMVPQVDTHRLTESDFLMWRHTLTMATTTSVRRSLLHMQQRPLAHRACVTSSARCMRYSSWSIVLSYFFFLYLASQTVKHIVIVVKWLSPSKESSYMPVYMTPWFIIMYENAVNFGIILQHLSVTFHPCIYSTGLVVFIMIEYGTGRSGHYALWLMCMSDDPSHQSCRVTKLHVTRINRVTTRAVINIFNYFVTVIVISPSFDCGLAM